MRLRGTSNGAPPCCGEQGIPGAPSCAPPLPPQRPVPPVCAAAGRPYLRHRARAAARPRGESAGDKRKRQRSGRGRVGAELRRCGAPRPCRPTPRPGGALPPPPGAWECAARCAWKRQPGNTDLHGAFGRSTLKIPKRIPEKVSGRSRKNPVSRQNIGKIQQKRTLHPPLPRACWATAGEDSPLCPVAGRAPAGPPLPPGAARRASPNDPDERQGPHDPAG